MDDTKNALAELAERLEYLKGRLGYENAMLSMLDLIKAQRIVAELSKITWIKADPTFEDLAYEGSMPNMIGLATVFNRCRAIAEEAKHEKA